MRSDTGRLLQLVVALLVARAAVAGIATSASQSTPKSGDRDAPRAGLPGLQTSHEPWPAEHAHLAARLQAVGLPALSEEGSALHTHQHLDVFVAGRPMPVPANIGVDPNERFIAPIHTHDASGVIHIESPTVETFTLGQFFDVWGVRFDAHCLGAYCASGGRRLRVYANGQPVDGDPRRLPLTPHQEIVVAYGGVSDVPKPVPSSYKFPKGL